MNDKLTYVTVISIWSKDETGSIPDRRSNRVYTVGVVPGDSDEHTLERAFNKTNFDGRPCGRSVCSSTCGDIFILNGQHWFCDRSGFVPVTAEQSLKIQQLSSRDTGMGWDWMTQHVSVK